MMVTDEMMRREVARLGAEAIGAAVADVNACLSVERLASDEMRLTLKQERREIHVQFVVTEAERAWTLDEVSSRLLSPMVGIMFQGVAL